MAEALNGPMHHGRDASYLLVVNPVSGRGGGRHRARALAEALGGPVAARDRPTVEVVETRARGDATSVARSRAGDVRRLVAVGGDGTLNEVLRGLWELKRPAHELPELAFLPSGTANAAAPAFGLHSDPLQVARRLESAPSRPVDVGVARTSEGVERPFLLWCGAGYDAVVIEALNASRDGRMGILGLLLNGPRVAARIAAHREALIEGIVDGESWPSLGSVVVANVPDIAFGGTIAARADPFDGKLDVVAVPGGVKRRLPFLGLAMLSGGLQGARGARWDRASELTLRSDGVVPVQIDGEPAGRLPLDVRTEPGAVRLLLT